MKKQYQSPTIEVAKMAIENLMLVGSIQGNANIKMGGGGSGPARGREGTSWDDDDE